MKRKTINKEIKKKINDWIDSIEDKDLASKLRTRVIVTGGCIASMLMSEKVNDYDIYIEDKDTLYQLVKYYLKSWEDDDIKVEQSEDRVSLFLRSSGVLDLTKEKNESKYRLLFASENALTLSDKIQIVMRFFGKAEEIHENYDFVHCTNYWTHKGLCLNEKALTSLITKELQYIGSRYPICSVIRTRKFLNRGFTINAGQYLKMCYQISKLDLNDVDVLRDQLVGVDSAYFDILINQLTKKGKDFTLTDSYLSEMIDRIF